jgi:rubrerythrin
MENVTSIQTEVDASFLYALLAEHEEDSNVAHVFREMSEIEMGHAKAFLKSKGLPESNMPGYPWLQKNAADASSIQSHMVAMRRLGVPYTDEMIAEAPKELEGKTEEDALIAYLQGLGVNRRYIIVDEAVAK